MKTIEIQLLDHKKLASTTLTDLLLVGPLPDASYRGFTQLTQDMVYDDADVAGSITYYAHTGLQMAAIATSDDLGVDNSEAQTLFPIASYLLEGFTQAQIDAGALDKTPFVVYRVNYKDLTAGRHEVMASGTIGEQTNQFDQVAILELRSLQQQLGQSIGELDSITCRATFGSQPIGTGGGVVEERFPCGFDLTSEWVSGTVTSLGSEHDREFNDTALAISQPTADYFAPGMVEMLTGDNAGIEREVDSYTAGAVGMQFAFPAMNKVGDNYRIRRDCTKNKNGHNSCKGTFWLSSWALHLRGEPAINPAAAAAATTPGAAISRSLSGGTGEQLA